MEVHVVDRDNAHLYPRMLDLSYRIRAQIFLREMKWRALRETNGRERDQFDDDTATYLFAVDQGRLIGGARRHCSLDDTLLGCIFPHLAERGFERSADVYEATRLHVVPERRTENPSKVAGVLNWAMWANALALGGRAIHLVTYASYVPALARSGLRPQPLGLPTLHEDMTLIAVKTAVDAKVLQDLLVYYDVDPVPLVRDGDVALIEDLAA